jgi:hypothetical protein
MTMVRMAAQKPAAGATSCSRPPSSPVGDPHQEGAAGEHQAGHLQQPQHCHGEAGAHGDGADRAPQDGLALVQLGQVARRQRDDDGVVAGQHQVDHDDRCQGRPEFRAQEQFHASSLVLRRSLAGAGPEEN